MMLRGAKAGVGALLLSAGVAAVAAGVLLPGSDLLLDRGFGKALDLSRGGLSFTARDEKDALGAATAGDEGFWLTRAEVESTAPFAKPLAVGDRITIAGRDGHQRQLEVVDLKRLGTPAARSTGAHVRLLLVSCRVAGEAPGRGAAIVRFIIEAEPQDAPRVGPKAL